MSLVIDGETAAKKSRLALVSLAALYLRMMENWRRTQVEVWQGPLDYDSTMIMLAIVAIRSDKVVRSRLGPMELLDLKNAVPEDLVTRCNVSSIASATGLNRETVRRKVRNLEARRLVSRASDGSVSISSDALPSEKMAELLRAQLDALRSVTAQLCRNGIFRCSDGEDQ